jgi:hypothetical protein
MKKTLLTNLRTPLIPLGVGLLASIFLTTVYFGIVSWADSVSHAVVFFWHDRWIVLPIIIGFGVQAALYTILKWRLYMPVSVSNSIGSKQIPATGASMGVSGTTSTVAMVACCVHHVTDVLPILGLTVAATFLAKYRLLFMGIGLGMTFIGISYMLFLLIRASQRARTIILNSHIIRDVI